MSDWIYCGTNPPVDSDGTQSLLRTHSAIWCSPPGWRPWPSNPKPNERLWLLWRNTTGGPILLLGGGRIAQSSQSRYNTIVLHTNTDIPGVRIEAVRLGYGGGYGMTFLRLDGVVFPASGQPAVDGIGTFPNALSEANELQIKILNSILWIQKKSE